MDQFNEKIAKWSNDPRNIEKVRESCPFNVVTHGAMGFAFGGFLGMFLASMSAGGTSPEAQLLNPTSISAETVPIRMQVRHALTDMIKRSWSSAKNFGLIAALYSGSECIIEGVTVVNYKIHIFMSSFSIELSTILPILYPPDVFLVGFYQLKVINLMFYPPSLLYF